MEREVLLIYGKTGMGKTRWTIAFLKSARRLICLDPMREHEGVIFDDLADMIEHVQRYRLFRVRSEWPDDFPTLAALAMGAGHCFLVVEESQRVLPARAALPAAFENVIYRGRHRRVSPVLVSQRPSTVHIAARSQWTRLIIFNQTEPADCRWLSEQSGLDDESFSLLKPGEYYDVTPWREPQKKVLTDQRPMVYTS